MRIANGRKSGRNGFVASETPRDLRSVEHRLTHTTWKHTPQPLPVATPAEKKNCLHLDTARDQLPHEQRKTASSPVTEGDL